MFNFARAFIKTPEMDQEKTNITPLGHRIDPKGHESVQTNFSDFDHTYFFMMSPDIMLLLDEGGVICKNNDALPAEFETGCAFINIIHEEDRPALRNAMHMMRMSSDEMNEPSLKFEARLACAGQEQFYVWTIQAQGNFTYVIGRNLTSIKEQQSEVDRNMMQLVQAESIGRFGRWNWRIGDAHMDWSDQLYQTFGVMQNDFIPSFDNVYNLIHEDDRNRMEQTLQRAVINQNEFDIDFCVVTPSGEQRYLRCEGRCGLDHQGEAIALYGIMQDMTERILYEHDLRSAKESAEQAYAAKSQFLANMSHELRTPLNAIIGFSEMIESQIFGPLGHEKYLEYGTNIKQSGAHLLDLIGDILDMSKIEAGKYDLDLEEVMVAPLIKTAREMIETRAAEKNITLGMSEAFNEELHIVADRRACLQIMLNILSNAVKFTGENGQIDIQCREKADYIRIKISDNGIGIPANKIDHITKPFEQVSPHYTRDHEGSGLGLAITKELIELHGGTLMIESQVNVGTDVIVILPTYAGR